jgi:hypothetical protein
MSGVQPPVQLPCSMRVSSVPATPCLPIGELHACTRAARSPTGIGSQRGGKGPPQPQHTANARLPASRMLSTALDEQLSAPVLAWCGFRREITVSGALVTSYADTVQTRLTADSTNAVISAISGRRPHDGKSREGIYARVAAASFTLVERKTRSRGRSRNLEMPRDPGDGAAARGGARGVGALPGCLGIIDIFRLSRGASEIFGGRPEKIRVYK